MPESAVDEIRIPNDATYAPVSLTDLMMAAPLASRLVLGATLPGRMVQVAALGLYAGSVVKDWQARRGIRSVDFVTEYGADVHRLDQQPTALRRREIAALGDALNRDFTPERRSRRDLARQVNRALTDHLAGVTGQRVLTSDEIREVSLVSLVFPFAMGTCDILSGDVAIFRDTGIFEPHIIAHEFVHRRGYMKELHAQVLAWFALRHSGDPLLVQAARAERLHRQLRVVAGDDPRAFREAVAHAGLRDELAADFNRLRPDGSLYQSIVGTGLKQLYDMRMRLTGQNGLSDYDEGFTNFLYTFSRSPGARQPRHLAAV
jgi:hypothetical protein